MIWEKITKKEFDDIYLALSELANKQKKITQNSDTPGGLMNNNLSTRINVFICVLLRKM